MAEVLDDKTPMPPPWGPWNEWLDGRKWRLVRGVDYNCDETRMARRARQAARRRGVRVIVRLSREMRHVYVQAVPIDDAA
jgi:hypothetical protein